MEVEVRCGGLLLCICLLKSLFLFENNETQVLHSLHCYIYADILLSGLTSHAYFGDVGVNWISHSDASVIETEALNLACRVAFRATQRILVPLLCSFRSKCFVLGCRVTLGYEDVCSSCKVSLDFFKWWQKNICFVLLFLLCYLTLLHFLVINIDSCTL